MDPGIAKPDVAEPRVAELGIAKRGAMAPLKGFFGLLRAVEPC